MKHHSLIVDFFNLDFEKIDIEILADEDKEQEEVEVDATGEKDAAGGKDATGDQGDEAVVPPS